MHTIIQPLLKRNQEIDVQLSQSLDNPQRDTPKLSRIYHILDLFKVGPMQISEGRLGAPKIPDGLSGPPSKVRRNLP